MAKNEVSWKRRTPDGGRYQAYAERVGGDWRFYWREQRYERWQALEDPPLEDWMELLDGVRRRIARRLLRPEEEDRVKRAILERYPGADLTG